MISAFAILAGALFGVQIASGAPGNLGTNLSGVNYWDGSVPFNNIVRQGGEWVGEAPFTTDRNGWPTRLEGPVSMAIAELSYPAGRYTVKWRGRGSFTVGNSSFRGRSGRGSVVLDGSSLALLTITSTDRRNHLRNIQVLVPGARSGAPFRSRFLASLAPYRTIRFMDWQKTNGTFSDPVPRFSCSTATRPSSISQGRRGGVAVRWMVRLANRLDANPWFTVPHKADQSWLRCHAQTVSRLLERQLTPRYEFSNETWNPAFEQFFDLTEAAEAEGLGGGDDYLGLQLEVARRHNAMVDVIAPVMGKKNRRFIRVLGGQAANYWVLEQRLLGGAEAKTDEIAIAPYMHLVGLNAFDPADGPAITSMTPEAVITNLRSGIELEVIPWVEDHFALARQTNKKLVSYEGGQHLAGDGGNEAMTSLFTGVNRSQPIGLLYDEYLARWKALTGNALFMHFTDSGPYSRFGSWGALESPDQDFGSSPKYQALLRFRAG